MTTWRCCTRPIRWGAWAATLSMRAVPCASRNWTRTIGVSLEDIRHAECVLACVADRKKAAVLHAALVGGYIDVLMVDSITARLLLDIHSGTSAE